MKLTEEEKRTKRLKDMGIENKKIIKYNAFGEIIAEYKNPFDAEKNIPISMSELKLNLNGNNLKYKDFVLRYEDVSFDFYPMSKYLNPVVLYDLQGNYVNRFKSHQDAEKYLGITRGELTKVLKRGGSVKKYLVSEYGKEIERKTMRLEHTYEMLSDDYKVIKTFNTYKEIANMFGLIDCSTCVLNAIRNNTMYRGFYWRFKDEYPINDYIV